MIPDVSVIIPAYNAMPYMTKTLETVVGQTLGLDRMELIAVDNGSTDDTLAELERFATTWPGMLIIHLDENSGGPARPRNVGLERATGRYVFFLDADDYLGLEALERMVTMADKQQTDVVVGRMVGEGGRGAPRSMFTHTQPKTTLLESRAYWSLTVMKLFRRDLVERLGLRFDENMRAGEDLPFVALAYLGSSAISIIADYECVYWALRDDGSNVTSGHTLEDHLVWQEVMIPLVVENTEEGPLRTHLLHRHFEWCLFNQVRRCVFSETQAGAHCLDVLKGWVDELYTDEIARRCPVPQRVVYELMRQGRIDEIAAVYEMLNAGGPDEYHLGAGQVYAPYPGFRDGPAALPDWCFDDTTRVRMDRFLSQMTWDGDVLMLAGHARIERLARADATTKLMLRKRGDGTEYIVDVEPAQPAGSEALGSDGLEASGFVVHIDPLTAANGSPLDHGMWDLFIRIEIEDLVVDNRLGGARMDTVDTQPRLRLVGTEMGRSLVVTPYFTQTFGNLTLDVGETGHEVDLAGATAQWDSREPATLVLDGTTNATGIKHGQLVVGLAGPGGATHRVPAEPDEGDAVTRFTARVDLKTCASRRPLPVGTWEAEWSLSAGGRERAALVPCDDGLDTRRWWSGVTPMHARVPAELPTLTVKVKPVDLTRALRRRLGL